MNKLQRKFQQWRALQPWERRLLVEFAVFLPSVWLGLRLLGFKRVYRFAQPEISPSCIPRLPYGPNAADYAQRCAELASIAGRHGLYQANCLHQALALSRALRRRGLQAQLMIGIKPATQPFEAHAWVELDSQVLGKAVCEYLAFSQLGLPCEPKTGN